MRPGCANPMRALVVLAILILLASPVRAEVYGNAFLRAEAASVNLSPDKSRGSVSLAVTNSTAAPYSIVFLSAVLKDDRGYFFELAARPTGIATGRPFNCQTGAVLPPGATLVVGFSFRISPRLAPDTTKLKFSAEFQAQRGSCENFTVSLNNLSVVVD